MSSSTIPKATKDAVNRRADCKCEFSGGIHNLDYAHITHRRLGGRHGKWAKIINDPRNVCLLARPWHDIMHGHETTQQKQLVLYLKLKTDWYSWAKEFSIFYEEEV
jgi:hypothetical protein